MDRLFVILIAMLLSVSADTYAQTGEDPELDSLISVYHQLTDNDGDRMSVCCDIARMHCNVDSTIMWSDRLLSLADRAGSDSCRFKAYTFKGWAAYYKLDYTATLDYYYKALSIANKMGSDSKKAIVYTKLVDIYRYVKHFQDAEVCRDSAMRILKRLGDSICIVELNRYMACIYDEQMIYELSSNTLKDNLRIDSMMGCNDELLIDLQFLIESCLQRYGLAKQDFSLVKDALRYCRTALSVDSDDGFSRRSLLNFYNKSLYYDLMENDYSADLRAAILDTMRVMALEERRIADETGMSTAYVNNAVSWIDYNIAAGAYDRAKYMLDSLRDCIEDSNLVLYLNMSYRDYYMAIGDYKSSIKYIDLLYADRLESCSPANAVKYAKSIEKEKYEQLQRGRDFRERTRKIIFIAVIVVISFALVFVAFAFYSKRRSVLVLNAVNATLVRQKKEILCQKEEIQSQKDEIEKQNVSISKQHEQITSSINYASLIQRAALPKDDYIRELFSDYFIIYRPLHIVAGDFYWASRVGRYRIMVCADCTGHGVPGAFLSMLGISLLNEVSPLLSADCNAAKVLDVLRTKLMHALNQSKNKYQHGAVYSMDGMDLSMVVFEDGSSVMQFAGAYRPLWIWRGGGIIQYKPDKMPIGIYLGAEKNFTNHEIEVQSGDVLYMFSDGIPDQFGYIDDTRTLCKHFSQKRLAQLLAGLGDLPMERQKEIVEKAVDDWKNGYKQLDDNIMMGIRI